MDSEHRHELKTNELADWLGHIPDFVRENASRIIGVVIVVAALLTWPYLNRRSERADMVEQAQTTNAIEQLDMNKRNALQGQGQGMYMSDSLLISADSLEMAAKESKNPLLSAMALIKRGDAFRAYLHYSSGEETPEVIASRIAQAKEAYEQAIERAKGNQTLTAMAKFGLGLCAEEVGNFDGAKKIYNAIIANSEFEHTVFAAQAQFRLDIMDDNKEQFTFVEAPEPAEILVPGAGTETDNVFIETIPEPEAVDETAPAPAEAE